jgi:hypothetical protein
MRTTITRASALTVGLVLALAVPAAADPACDAAGAGVIHDLHGAIGVGGDLAHEVEEAYCATPLP